MTRGQDLDDDVAWVSEVSDSPGSYSCLQLTHVLNIHQPELSWVCSDLCPSPQAKQQLFCLIRREVKKKNEETNFFLLLNSQCVLWYFKIIHRA